MEYERHDTPCSTNKVYDDFGACDCTRDQRLAARLAQMMAAGAKAAARSMGVAVGATFETPAIVDGIEEAIERDVLDAIAHAREAP